MSGELSGTTSTAPCPLAHQLELAEAGPAELFVEEQRPQALVPDLLLQRIGQRLDLGIAGIPGTWKYQLERLKLAPAELLDPFKLLGELRLSREVPRHSALLCEKPTDDARRHTGRPPASAY